MNAPSSSAEIGSKFELGRFGKRQILLATILLTSVLLAAAIRSEGYPTDNVEPTILQLEHELSKANLRSDVDTLHRLLADEYFAIESNGTVQTKEQEIAELTAGHLKIDEETPLKVRVFRDVAVVTGSLSLAEDRGGVKRKLEVLFTDVWVKRGDSWQLVSYQGTRVP